MGEPRSEGDRRDARVILLERGFDRRASWHDFPARPARFRPTRASTQVAEPACGDAPGTDLHWLSCTDAGRRFHVLIVIAPTPRTSPAARRGESSTRSSSILPWRRTGRRAVDRRSTRGGAAVADGCDPRRRDDAIHPSVFAVLIGAHVSPAGGPAKAVERGVERGCRSVQIFNQNPRAWKPREYSDQEVEDFHAAMAVSEVDALVIHAVYLINLASEDGEILEKSLTSLIGSLRAGALLDATGVVLHAGSALKNGGAVDTALERAAGAIGRALAETEECLLQLENTAGAGGTLGRSFEELARMIELAGGDERLGVCLDSAHLLASGYDVRSPDSLAAVLDDFDAIVGLDRLKSLHVNDSQVPLGANRDRHIALGDGEIGRAGCAAFLSEPRFDGLPCIFEGPGVGGKQVEKEDIEIAFALREEGLATRGSAVTRRQVTRPRRAETPG